LGTSLRIKGLRGEYCGECVESLTRYTLNMGAIVPMCRADLDTFLHNGDYETVSKTVKEKSNAGRTNGSGSSS